MTIIAEAVAKELNSKWDILGTTFDKHYDQLEKVIQNSIKKSLSDWQDFYYSKYGEWTDIDYSKWKGIYDKALETLVVGAKDPLLDISIPTKIAPKGKVVDMPVQFITGYVPSDVSPVLWTNLKWLMLIPAIPIVYYIIRNVR